jgi:Uma2 family endonuclease
MVTIHTKPVITQPTSTPPAEPVLIPRPGRPWTEADLHALADDERHFELVRGDLLMMSPASPVQGRYAMRLGTALFSFVEEHALGEIYTAEPGFRLQSEPEATVRVPDIAFVSAERIPPTDQQQGFWPLAPDLAIEIISPSEGAASVQEKGQDYLAAGTRLVWLVYPRTHTVIAYNAAGQIRQFAAGDSLDGDVVLPGFSYALARLFA